MYKVTWRVDYIGNGIFLAELKEDSFMYDKFIYKKFSGDRIDLVMKEVYSETESTMDSIDHYGSIDYTVELELTDSLKMYSRRWLMVKKAMTILATILGLGIAYMFIQYVIIKGLIPMLS